jgi:hypothetical protein
VSPEDVSGTGLALMLRKGDPPFAESQHKQTHGVLGLCGYSDR